MNGSDHALIVKAVQQYVPDTPVKDELLRLVEIGAAFQCQHVGRRPSELRTIVLELLRKAGEPYTFERLILEMEYEALRRCSGFESRIDEVDREMESVFIDLPKTGIVERKFSAIRRHFDYAKKSLRT